MVRGERIYHKSRGEISKARGWSDDPKEGVLAFAGGAFDKAIEHASLGEGGRLPDIDYNTGEFETDPVEALKEAKSSGSGEPPSGGGGFQNEAFEEVAPYEEES